MARIKLPLPHRIDYVTNLSLRVYDLNYGDHMGNDSVLSLVHEARIRFLNSLGLNEKNFYGNRLLMADSAVVYKKEAFYGEILNIQICVSEFHSYGFDLLYLITNQKNSIEIARVKTGLVCYDHVKKSLVKLPNEFRLNFD